MNTEGAISPEIRDYFSRIGAKKTVAKINSSRANMAKAREARRRDPLDLPCVCAGGISQEAVDHKTTCPRGRLLWQRKRAAQKKVEVAQ